MRIVLAIIGLALAAAGLMVFISKPVPVGEGIMHGAINGGIGGAMIAVGISLLLGKGVK